MGHFLPSNPSHFSRCQTVAIEGGMKFSSLNDDHIATDIFTYHKPRLSLTAKAQAFALAQSVVGHSRVLAYDRTIQSFKISPFDGQVAGEKVFKIPLPNKANAGGVFFIFSGQIIFAGQLSHLRFL